jgi:hypothetical protein
MSIGDDKYRKVKLKSIAKWKQNTSGTVCQQGRDLA